MQSQITKLDFTGQNIYVGIDVHLKSWKVTVMMESGYQKTFSQDPFPLALRKYLETNFPGANYFSAYEAGFSGFMTHYKLLELGINSIVVNPADVPTTGKEKTQKDDSRDSKKIARSLKNGELVAIYVPSLASLDDRSLVRFRRTVAKDLAKEKTRIKAFLNFNGIEVPEDLQGHHWPKRFIQWLKDLELNPSCRKTLDGFLNRLQELHQGKLDAESQVRSLAKSAAYKKNATLLRSIPGVGLITAMMLLTELENMERFKSFDTLCSFVGLVPSTHSSGEKERTGDITPRGHKVLREAVIESAWIAISADPALGITYSKLCKRMRSQKAILRIAKKLLNRIRYVLKKGEPYVLGVAE